MKKVGGFIAVAFAAKEVVSFTKTAVNAASETQSAWTGLNSIVNGTGNSFKVAQDFITGYTRDGLVSVNEAVTAYKNLLSRGYNTSQIEGTMNALKDSASFGRQASYDLGEAVVTATEGLKNENSILVDNAGVTKNVAKMWDEYATSVGKASNNLTQAEKIQAEYNGILKETKFQTGDAVAYANTFSGQVQRLTASMTSLKVAVGKVVVPIAQLFIPIINSAVNALTNLFDKISKLLNVFGFKFQEVITKNSNSVTNFTSGIAESGDAAIKAAKKVNKAFANIDEVNVLNTKNDNSSNFGANNTSGAEISSLGNIEKITNSAAQTDGIFSKLINRVKELQSLFTKGFDTTFNLDFGSITKSIDKIKISLKNIFTDESVLKESKKFVNNLTFNLGRISGSIGTVGKNIAETLLGSIERYLSQNASRISSFITNIFKNSTKNLNITGDLFSTLADISEVFTSDNAKQIGTNIIAMFANPFMSLTTIFSQFGTDMYELLVTPITDNVDKIKIMFGNLLPSFETVSSTVATAFTYIGDSLTKLYDEHIAPYLENIKTGLSDTFGKFLDIYNTYIYPFVDNVTKDISNIWNTYLKPFFDNVMGIVGSIIDVIGILWNNSLKPLVDWIVQNVVPIIVPILSQVWNTVSTVFKSIMNVINTVMSILRCLIDFILGVFTGDWERAWDGIKTIFTGIFDGIKSAVTIGIDFISNTITNGLTQAKNVINGILNTIRTSFENAFNNIKTTITNVWNSILNLFSKGGQIFNGVVDGISGAFKSIVNTLIKGINSVIKTPFNGINSALKKIKNIDIFGAKPFSKLINTISVPKIPMLANGGWVAKNNPQLAIVGDNTREGEIITPESKIYDQVSKAIKDNGGSGNSQELYIVLEVRYEDGKKIIKKINQEQIDAGEILLLV